MTGGVGAPAVPARASPPLLNQHSGGKGAVRAQTVSKRKESQQVVDHPFTKFGGRGKRRASGRVKVGFLDGSLGRLSQATAGRSESQQHTCSGVVAMCS